MENTMITIQTKSGIPIYTQIEEQIKAQILEKKLRPGDPLPSIRTLAADLKISVITTKRAYEELEREGMIYSVQGKGFFVDDPDLQYLEEKRAQNLEGQLAEVLEQYRAQGYALKEILDIVTLLYEE